MAPGRAEVLLQWKIGALGEPRGQCGVLAVTRRPQRQLQNLVVASCPGQAGTCLVAIAGRCRASQMKLP